MGRLQITIDKCLLQKTKLEKSTGSGRGLQAPGDTPGVSPSTIPASRPLSTPARDGAYKFLRFPQETAPCQRAKERALLSGQLWLLVRK